MVLGSKPDFVPLIVAGTKVHSIRAGNRWTAGQHIQFCTHVQPGNMVRLQPDGEMKAVQAIRVEAIDGTYRVEIDGRQLIGPELAKFIGRDGFGSFSELVDFLVGYYGLPFSGQLIHWTDFVY